MVTRLFLIFLTLSFSLHEDAAFASPSQTVNPAGTSAFSSISETVRPATPVVVTVVTMTNPVEHLLGGGEKIIVSAVQMARFSPDLAAARTVAGNMDLNARVSTEAVKSIVPGITYSEAGDLPGGVLVVESPQQAQMIMGTARVLMPKLETLIFADLTKGRSGPSAPVKTGGPRGEYLGPAKATMVATAEASIRDLGPLLASSSTDQLRGVLTRRSSKYLNLETDRRASDYALSLWLVCYGLMHRDGKVLLSWAVARSIRKSNAFYNSVFNEIRSAMAETNDPKSKLRIKMMRKILENKDLGEIRLWLAELGKAVIVESEQKDSKEEAPKEKAPLPAMPKALEGLDSEG